MAPSAACADPVPQIPPDTGDASIQQAAHNGGITKVSYVDSEVKAILGIWAEYCTVVYGE